MTNAIQDNDPKPWLRVVSHYGLPAVVLVLLLGTAADVFAWAAESAIVSWARFGGLLLTLALYYGHNGRYLCGRCMAAVPLNGAAKAERWRNIIRFAHPGPSLWVMFPAIAVSLSASAFIHDEYVKNIVQDAAVPVPFAFVMVAGMLHSRVQPWCPWCRNGGTGEDERVPEPKDGSDRPVPV